MVRSEIDAALTAFRRHSGVAEATVRAVDGAAGSAELNEMLARTTSDWIVWADSSVGLASRALTVIRSALARFDVDVFYGDSLQPDGGIVRRPSGSPIRLRSQDYLGPVRGFRTEAVRQTGGFAPNASGSHAFELALRLCQYPARTLRIPEVLSVETVPSLRAPSADREVVSRFLDGLGIAHSIESQDGSLRIRYPVMGQHPVVSIIIPTRGSSALVHGRQSVLVVDAVRGIVDQSTYGAFEIVVVADDATPQAVIDQLILVGGERLRLVRWSEEFNFSAKMNRGALFARGEYLILLNDDVELISREWIETLLGLAQQEEVGLVGTLLFFEDGTVQHGGHLYTASWAGHSALGWNASRDDRLGSMKVDREVSGVTAACAMIRADTFWEVGGFSLDFAGNYNDVDLSLKVAATGRRNLWTPHATMMHFESKTRDAAVLPREIAALRARWGTRLLSDPYWTEQ
ncbi:glycosyltransferase [Lacisediminihabitans sp. H27-G8]